MRHSRHLRLTFLTCAVATTLIVGAKSVTNATGGADPLVADDLTFGEPVYRDGHYRLPGDQRVDLSASGGSGTLAYRIVSPPTADGEPVGTVSVVDDVATVTIEPSARPGPASFSYRAIDRDGRTSNIARVSFTVENRPPLTRDLALTTSQGAPLAVWPYARDAEDGGPFPWQREGNHISYGEPAHGRVESLFAGGRDESALGSVGHKAVYVPDPGYVGPDAFSYRFTDAEGKSARGSISVDVTDASATGDGSADVLYRCPLRVKVAESGESDPAGAYDPGATRIVSRELGGDLTFRVRGRMNAPRRLQPGEPYALPGVDLDLGMPQSTAEMLAGDDVIGEHLDLESAGLGQTALGGKVAASLRITETATSDAYDTRLDGLASELVPLELPVPEDGVTVDMTGTIPELKAPHRGAVVLSMPRVFDFDAEFEPGVRGVMSSVGMRCHAVAGQRLTLDRMPIRARTRTTAAASPTTVGDVPRVTVRVSGRAHGRVGVFEDTTALGTARVEAGRATVRLPGDLLDPGAHRLRVVFEGGNGFADSRGETTVRIREVSERE